MKHLQNKKNVSTVLGSIETFKSLGGKDGSTIQDLYNKKPFLNYTLGTFTTKNDVEIKNLILHYPNQKVAFNLSKALSEDVSILSDLEVFPRLTFQIRNKFVEGTDTEGEFPYSGAEYLSLGKPMEIEFVETELVEAEIAA